MARLRLEKDIDCGYGSANASQANFEGELLGPTMLTRREHSRLFRKTAFVFFGLTRNRYFGNEH